jgi:outer membrane protein OmpA-like peptidoglycan-associated protein
MPRKDDTFDMESAPQPSSGGGGKFGMIAAVLVALALGAVFFFNGGSKKTSEAEQPGKPAVPAAGADAVKPAAQSEAPAKAVAAARGTGAQGEGQPAAANGSGAGVKPIAPSAATEVSADGKAKEELAAKESVAAASDKPAAVKSANAPKATKVAGKKPAVRSPAKAVDAAPTGEAAGNMLGQVTFDFNKAEIRPGDQEKLFMLSKTLKGTGSLRIVGYTDDRGAEAINLRMSKDRAVTVAAYLRGVGVKSKLLVKGAGSQNPVAENGTGEGRAKNRRVEISSID